MKPILWLMLSLAPFACHRQKVDDGRTTEGRAKAEKTDKSAQQGALQKKADPAEDLKQQSRNLERLRTNEKENRANGNHIGAWATAQDARHVEALIAKDRATLSSPTEKSE